MVTLDQALDTVMQLSNEEREMLIEILRRRRIEEQREEIAASAHEAIEAFHAGKLKAETVEELLLRLHASVEGEGE